MSDASVKSREAVAFLGDESGVTAIEYALIGGFLTIALVAAVPSLTTALSQVMVTIAGYLP